MFIYKMDICDWKKHTK